MTFKKGIAYFLSNSGVAAMETAFIFPVLMLLLFGVVDIGAATLINTKIVTATQTASDLLTRSNQVGSTEISEARMAAESAMIPVYNEGKFGIDIAGILFEGEDATPTEVWRETFNMSPNINAINNSNGLGNEGDGIVIVTVQYIYTPRFSSFLTGDIVMQETSYARGRDSAFVAFD